MCRVPTLGSKVLVLVVQRPEAKSIPLAPVPNSTHTLPGNAQPSTMNLHEGYRGTDTNQLYRKRRLI